MRVKFIDEPITTNSDEMTTVEASPVRPLEGFLLSLLSKEIKRLHE